MTSGRFISGIDKARLRTVLALFFVALGVPTAVLVYQAYGQLRLEAFYQQRVLAEELAHRVDAQLRSLMAVEEARSLADYRFLVLQGDARTNFLQRSPLSNFPVDASIPGLLSYFQIDAHGAFSTPLLPVGVDPATFGVSAADAAQRAALEQRVRALLMRAQIGAAANVAPVAQPNESDALPAQKKIAEEKQQADKDAPQAVFDRLDDAEDAGAKAEPQRQAANAMGRVEDLKLDSRLATRSVDEARPQAPALAKSAEQSMARSKRKEFTNVPLLERGSAGARVAQFGGAVTTLESELDPFVLRRLDGEHFVLFRKVWLNGARLIQGAVIAQNGLIEGIVGSPFRETALSQAAEVLFAYKGDVVGAIDATATTSYAVAHTNGELLYRTSLSPPLNDVELIFTITQLPVGPGGVIVGWAALILGVVMCAGCLVMYRFGAAQIDLTRAQQNFVSAVSHELKTPLTSIRMYGEILKAGWASEEKKRTYYDFIYHESERLSRLIANVLQLARLTRNGERPEPKRVPVAQLLNLVESKIAAQVEQAGFRLTFDRADVEAAVVVDADSFVQILINLVDNALKFSARAERKEIEIGCRSAPERTPGRVVFRVRDYGPGIAPQHMKHIFKLFYRAEGELTRETVGTGIGLALVHELTSAMGGTVDVRNCDPGAEFTVAFPAASGL